MKDELLNKLKKYIDDGMSYSELSHLIKSNERTVRRWVKGEAKISPAWQKLIKQKLG